jgi:hypothetical protein
VNWRRIPFDIARRGLVGARSVALRSPRFSEWVTNRIRKFPWLYLKLVALFSEATPHQPETSLVTPDLTPATRAVLESLRAELAREGRE